MMPGYHVTCDFTVRKCEVVYDYLEEAKKKKELEEKE